MQAESTLKPHLDEALKDPGFVAHIMGEILGKSAPEAKFSLGQVVQKGRCEPSDKTPQGTRGVIMGSIHRPPLGTAYLVQWACNPLETLIFVVEWKLEPVGE